MPKRACESMSVCLGLSHLVAKTSPTSTELSVTSKRRKQGSLIWLPVHRPFANTHDPNAAISTCGVSRQNGEETIAALTKGQMDPDIIRAVLSLAAGFPASETPRQNRPSLRVVS